MVALQCHGHSVPAARGTTPMRVDEHKNLSVSFGAMRVAPNSPLETFAADIPITPYAALGVHSLLQTCRSSLTLH